MVSDFLAELGRKDIHVWGDGERLKCNAPEGALTPDLRAQLRDRKSEILEFLRTAEALARQQPAIVPLQPRGGRTPIYGVPGHPGDVFCFSDLVTRLGDDQPFYGLEPPGLDGRREPMDCVDDIASYFADQIQAFQPEGPYIIAGYCSGGATAFELARRLMQRGSTVPLLAMFGTPYPSAFRPLPRLAFNLRYWTGRVLLHGREIAKMPSFEARRRYLGDRFRVRLKAVNEAKGAATPDPVLARRARFSSAAITAVRRYAPLRYSGRVCLYLPNKAWLRSGTAPLRWRSAAPNSETYFGPDTCNGPLMLLEPDAPAFAELFRQSLAKEPTFSRGPGHTVTSVSVSTKPLACVVGDLSLVRALGRGGIPVAVAASEPDSPIRRSRYCRAVVCTPSWVDDPDAALGALVAWAAEQDEAPVLFYQGDHDLLALSRGRSRLAPYLRCVLPPAQLVEDVVDKLRFVALAERTQLPVPATLTLRRGSALVADLARWDRFPCVVKPSTRTRRFAQLARCQKALRVERREELERLAPLVEAEDADFVVQAAVEGGEELIHSYHAYVRPGGQIVGEFTGRKLRTAPRLYGFSTYVEITDDDEVRRLGRSVLERVGFSGVAKIDFKRDARTKRLYVLEINPRFNLWHHPGAAAGVSIPALVYRDCLEPGSARPAGPARAGVRWANARDDWRAYEGSRLRWLAEMLTVEVNESFMLRDPLPALDDLLGTLHRRLFKLLETRPRFRPAR